MVGLTLAIGDFVLILVSAMLWTGASAIGWVLLGGMAIGGVALLARRLRG